MLRTGEKEGGGGFQEGETDEQRLSGEEKPRECGWRVMSK